MRVMAIDVGQSGSRLQSADGSIQRSALGHQPDRTLVDTVGLLLQTLRIEQVDVVGLSLSGLRGDVPDPHDFGRVCSKYTGATRVAVADDGIAAHYGALAGADGVVLAVGTGVVVVAKSGDRTAHKDGDGPVIGDDGGGYDIGRNGLRAALRAAEGRGPATVLLKLAEAQHGPLRAAGRTHSDAEVMRWCVDFAHAVLVSADEGDAVAQSIRAEAARQLAASATAAWHDVDDTVEPVLCSGTGGILMNVGMRSELVRAVAQRLPTCSWRDPLGNNLDGITTIARMTPEDSPPLLRWWFAS